MSTTKRPSQVLFYPTEKVQTILADLDKGERSEFINKAVTAYAERKAGGSMYPLEQAYETLKMMPTPEAETVRSALREILWRRSDTPDAVLGKLYLADNTMIVDHFADFEKAAMIALSRPDVLKMEVYTKDRMLISVGTRTEENTFWWT